MRKNLSVIMIILIMIMVGCGKEAVIATNGSIEVESAESVNNISEDSEKTEEKTETTNEIVNIDSLITDYSAGMSPVRSVAPYHPYPV